MRTTIKFCVALALSMPPLARAGDISTWLISNLTPGKWYEIPNTKMSDVFPSRTGHPGWGVQGPRAVTKSWGGGAFDTKRNVFVLTGGGHTDYGGNEVYEFHLDTLKWVRTTDPSPMSDLGNGMFSINDSEAPVSSHTYDGLLYVPTIDKVFKVGGAYYRSGTSYDLRGYLYDVTTHQWKRVSGTQRRLGEVTTGFDPLTGDVLVGSNWGLYAYTPLTDAWKRAAPDSNDAASGVGEFDWKNRKYVQIDSYALTVSYFDLTKALPRIRVQVSGNVSWKQRPGMAYHPPSGKLIVWDGDPGVWSLDSSTWTSQKLMPADGKGPAMLLPDGRKKSAGIYGRWQYIPAIDAFIGYVDSLDNVWIYKLPVAFNALPAGATAGR